MANYKITDKNTVNIDGSCTIVINNSVANINYNFKSGDYKVIVFSDANGDVTLNEVGTVKDANVLITYLQLDHFDLLQNSKIDVDANSSLDIHTTYLGCNNKKVIFDLYNKGEQSSVNINNNIVCLQDANFSLDCIGTIVKGASRSKCHQNTHCLTMQSPEKARVLPVLNIDEDEVEASHSLSCGTIDEEILFYMNSRGLSSNESLGLILRSYLIPSDDFYNEYDLNEYLKNAVNEKVNEVCSI